MIHTYSVSEENFPSISGSKQQLNNYQHYIDETRGAYNSKNIIETLDFKDVTVEPRRV